MYQASLKDTIAAISTSTGSGGIGIVRLSGKNALAISDKMFLAKSKKKPKQFRNYSIHYGWVVDKKRSQVTRHKSQDASDEKRATNDEVIDEVLLSVMRGPKSYTAEDVVEISCHGGIVPLRKILQLAIDNGARLAEPGEFTKRAFLSGRIDLTQAEAVLDIVRSKTDAFLKVSVNQLKGELTLELESIRDALMSAYTQIEAVINFPEEDIKSSGKSKISKDMRAAIKRIEDLLSSSEHGRILKEGIRIVLCGKPNVGKSSLLNVLLKHPRAIVTEVAGTTRDTIEETAQIKGIPFQLVDTAGILEPRDLIEQEAIKRSHMYIESADLIILIFDASGPLSDEDEMLIEKTRDKNVIVAINKIDLKSKINESKVRKKCKSKKIIKVSAIKKTAINKLEDEIVKNVWHGKTINTHGVLLSNMRHIESLKNCLKETASAKVALSDETPLEIISDQIKRSIGHLDTITGRNVTSDLLERIFSEFCIGK